MWEHTIMFPQSHNHHTVSTMKKMSVPENLNNAILETLNVFADEFSLFPGNTESANYYPIDHEPHAGYMPFTNGGYDLMVESNLDQLFCSGEFPTHQTVAKKLHDTIDTAQQDAVKEFCIQHASALKEFFTPEQVQAADLAVINYHTLYKLEAEWWAESLDAIEREYLRATFWYVLRIMFFAADNERNESGEDEICFMAGTNLDYEYARDYGLTLAFDKTVPVSQLTPKIINSILHEAVNKI